MATSFLFNICVFKCNTCTSFYIQTLYNKHTVLSPLLSLVFFNVKLRKGPLSLPSTLSSRNVFGWPVACAVISSCLPPCPPPPQCSHCFWLFSLVLISTFIIFSLSCSWVLLWLFQASVCSYPSPLSPQHWSPPHGLTSVLLSLESYYPPLPLFLL